jgi:hypothetical protein
VRVLHVQASSRGHPMVVCSVTGNHCHHMTVLVPAGSSQRAMPNRARTPVLPFELDVDEPDGESASEMSVCGREAWLEGTSAWDELHICVRLMAIMPSSAHWTSARA